MFKIEKRICFCDTDATGVTYHSKYLDFCEEARLELLLSLNLSQKRLMSEYGIMSILRSCSVTYLKPTRIEDLLSISVEKVEIRRARMRMYQNIYRGEERTTECIIDLATVDRNFKIVRKMPQEIVDRLMNCEYLGDAD